MKFGHEFKQHLLQDGFPLDWVDAAISYRQLKKCIKRVQKELASLGLDAATLTQLLETVEKSNSLHDAAAQRPIQYLLSDSGVSTPVPGRKFHPKLVFAIDGATGEPLDARLAPETKEYLHQLALNEKLTHVKIAEIDDAPLFSDLRGKDPTVSTSTESSSAAGGDAEQNDQEAGSIRLMEVPLTSDSEFFNMLQTELSGLAQLQTEEQRKLNERVVALSKTVSKVTQSNRAHTKDLAHWRKVFELYLDARVFFATTEQDHGAHDAQKAEKNLFHFQKLLQEQGLDKHFSKKESQESLRSFLQLNHDLLQMLKFQEINQTAMTKILKKFDKRTALDIKNTFPKAVEMPALSENVAKAVCYQISTELLTVVPQLDDYLCPVCFSISYKPVRLECQHVFCIRCLVVMQRERKDKCPLCRGSVVMKADSTNIDASLANFLKKFFAEEVKAKQKDNERAAGVDAYGEEFDSKCSIM